MYFACFLSRKTPSKDNFQLGQVQCTRCQIWTGANAPAKPVLLPPLYYHGPNHFNYVSSIMLDFFCSLWQTPAVIDANISMITYLGTFCLSFWRIIVLASLSSLILQIITFSIFTFRFFHDYFVYNLAKCKQIALSNSAMEVN